MAKKSMILKQQAPAKFSTRKYNRCKLCGRPHAYLRDYGVCLNCTKRETAFRRLSFCISKTTRWASGSKKAAADEKK